MIYAFIGRKRSGKNTAADILKLRLDEQCLSYIEVAFADRIKKPLAAMFGVSESVFHDQTKKEVISCRNYLYQWARNKKLDINKINLITSLIFLNIAPLHHVPYRFFLYYLGKYLLCLSLKQRNIGLYEKA